MKKIQIPIAVLPEVQGIQAEIVSLRKQIDRLMRKKEIARLQLWLKLGEAIPETENENASLNSDNWTVEIEEEGDSKSNMPPYMKKMLDNILGSH